MTLTYEIFQANLARVRAEIDETCALVGRTPSSVRLLPVTKNHPPEIVDYVVRAGLGAVGENRVQEARQKRPLAASTLHWELIGHLQSNKARLAASLFQRIQSVDSTYLLDRLEKAAADADRTLALLLQVNTGADPAKTGCTPEQTPALLEHALGLPHLRVEGLMTIAPLDNDPDTARRAFENLRVCRDSLADRFHIPLAELSMGMSADLRQAIAAGSTLLRIGTALFGSRT